MLIEFFLKLKQGGLPVSIKEFLTLLEALDKRVIHGSIDDFYYLSRTCLVKDESNYDKFDRVFGAYGYNPEPGALWMQRMLAVYKDTIWLNPQPEPVWDYHESIRLTRELIGERMFPLTLEGLDRGMRLLSKGH